MPANKFFADGPAEVGLDPNKVQALLDRAERDVRDGILPACQVAEMVAQTSSSPGVENPFQTTLHQLDDLKFSATVAETKVRVMRAEFQAHIDATKAQLEKMP